MSTQMSQEYPGEVRREMKSRFEAVNSASEERRRLRRESGDFKEAKAYNRPSKLFIDNDGEVDVYDGMGEMGENDSLGG